VPNRVEGVEGSVEAEGVDGSERLERNEVEQISNLEANALT
jgi:hypothetical protein